MIDHDEDERHRIEHVDDAHHQIVDPAAEIAGDGAIRHADHQRHQRRHQPDHQRNPRAPQQPRQQIAAQFIAAAKAVERPARRTSPTRASIIQRFNGPTSPNCFSIQAGVSPAWRRGVAGLGVGGDFRAIRRIAGQDCRRLEAIVGRRLIRRLKRQQRREKRRQGQQSPRTPAPRSRRDCAAAAARPPAAGETPAHSAPPRPSSRQYRSRPRPAIVEPMRAIGAEYGFG